MGPPDPILGLSEAFVKDDFEKKVNVGVGAYRDDSGKPFVLNSVRTAEKRVLDAKMNHEYAPIIGVKSYVDRSLEFVYGKDSPAISADRIAAVQALSGTGALRVCFQFLDRFMPSGSKTIYMPQPTWGNHIPVAKDSGLDVEFYKYYDQDKMWMDFDGMLNDVKSAPDGSAFLLHACAHNPTGIDPSEEEWRELSAVMKSKGHVPVFDSAYQGFASGDAEKDAFAIRHFVEDGHNVALCQSYAKNFGLYGERIGTFSIVCSDSDERDRVLSQIKILVRPMYSNPPIYGARVVDAILSDDELCAEWRSECKSMADRIIRMREALVSELVKAGSTRDWSHVTRQIGMFCFSGLTPEQVDSMVNDHHVYMTRNGRISMAGITSDNVGYIANAMHEVSK